MCHRIKPKEGGSSVISSNALPRTSHTVHDSGRLTNTVSAASCETSNTPFMSSVTANVSDSVAGSVCSTPISAGDIFGIAERRSSPDKRGRRRNPPAAATAIMTWSVRGEELFFFIEQNGIPFCTVTRCKRSLGSWIGRIVPLSRDKNVVGIQEFFFLRNTFRATISLYGFGSSHAAAN